MTSHTRNRDTIRVELINILTELRDDWEYSGEITEKTGIFSDLEFESIDVVALGSVIEDHYDQSLPFAEFLTKAGERNATEIYVADLVDFIAEHVRLNGELQT